MVPPLISPLCKSHTHHIDIIIYYNYNHDKQSYTSLALDDLSPVHLQPIVDIYKWRCQWFYNITSMIAFNAREKNKKLRIILMHYLLKL